MERPFIAAMARVKTGTDINRDYKRKRKAFANKINRQVRVTDHVSREAHGTRRVSYLTTRSVHTSGVKVCKDGPDRFLTCALVGLRRIADGGAEGRRQN